ncbi:MAG TPA: biotin--[acetyl-CoA-carboxylase] ligase [Nocardioidaceae bacterium]|nr:biotin--[acetyl-CoA-carboxylase] ligase [Nocardioidaceae bacterium]
MTYDDLRRPPLDPVALSAALAKGGSVWREIEVLPACPSTNAEVAARARAGAEAGLVLVADHQTSGRGRLDRAWVTPPGAALTFSVLLAPDRVPVARWPWLPLLAGIAVAEGVRRVAKVDCSLKWPNDVLVDDRKLAGILVERVERPSGAVAVVGVGLNVSQDADELPVPTATSLAIENAATTDRTVVLREVLRSLEALFVQWVADLGDPGRGLVESYVRRCGTLGREVRVDLPAGEQVVGVATGIDAEGRLEVRTPHGRRILGAGDVVHVRPLS